MSENINRKLWSAARRGDEALVSHLIEQGAEVDWSDEIGSTALHEAAERGHTPVITRLLDSGWSLEMRDGGGYTPLFLAALHSGHLETVKTLLLRGANIDTQDGDIKETLLYGASSEGYSSLVKLLLQCGADQQIRNTDGNTAEDAADIEETRAVFREFNKKGLNNKNVLFDHAVEEKEYDVAAVLAYSSQDANILNNFFEILDMEKIKDLFVLDFFHRSVSKNASTALTILQYFNKNMSAYNSNNTFHHGASNKSVDILRLSLEHGVNIEEKNLDGNTPLHIAAASENIEPLKYLIENGSKIEEKNLEGNTALHISVKSENENLIKYLMEKGSNIEEKNVEGNTPLHMAAVSDNETLVKLLLENGASSTQFMKNKDGKIPLELARHNKYIFRTILIDFLNYALKSPKFSSNDFQDQLGSGVNLFCLKRDFEGNKTLLEFLNDQGLVKEREELIQLLIKIDQFRFKADGTSRSERRIIKILRAGMKPSRGLKESIDSVQDKYPWKNAKIAVKCTLSVVMCLLGLALYASDIATDWHFYSTLDQNDKAAKIATLVHIILPLAFSLLVILALLFVKFLPFNWYLFFKIPLPPFTKIHKAIIECKSFANNKRKEEADYDTTNTKLIQEYDDQKNITTISMIIEASMESSFQFLFQGLFSLPTLVFSFLDIHEGTLQMKDLVNWKHLSIVLSFLSFAFTSFNIRWVIK